MKTLLIIALCLSIISCSKSVEMPEPAPEPVTYNLYSSNEISIDSVSYKYVYAGSNMSIEFKYYVSDLTPDVKYIELICENSGSRGIYKNLHNGENVAYDRLAKTRQVANYYFEINKTDGSILTTNKFKVY